jgi:GT2 family glycosyltransferase
MRCVITGNFIPAQRDLIVERALESGVDILIMCDDDMVLPADAFARLCATLTANPRAAIAGALYYSRDGFRPMVVDNWNEDDTRTAIIPAFDREPVAVDGIGFGCVALRVSALRELVPPYFSSHVFIEREAGRVRICDEDYLFCAKLRRANWLVLLDPSVRCGHYNRQLQRTMPDVWEGADATSQPRMAALVDGRPMLIPVSDAPANTSEAHVQANVQYIVVP